MRDSNHARALKQGRNVNTLAANTIAEVDDGKNPLAVALGRLGGLKGGKAGAAILSQKKRSEIAKKAAAARWGKR